MADNIVSIGGHSKMTPDEALDVSTRIDWKSVVIIGCDQDDNYKIHCSEMTRAQILYYLETARLDIMQPALAALVSREESQ